MLAQYSSAISKTGIHSQLCSKSSDVNSVSLLRVAVLSDSSGESSRTFSRIWDCEVRRVVDIGMKMTNSWSSPGFQPSSLLFRGAVAFVSGLEPKLCGTGRNVQYKWEIFGRAGKYANYRQTDKNFLA